jgi:hypothetical protein
MRSQREVSSRSLDEKKGSDEESRSEEYKSSSEASIEATKEARR